jgi:Tfp pilus assembly protein FimT
MPAPRPLSSQTSPPAPGRTGEAGLSLVEVLVTLSISAFAAVLIIATARPADPLRSDGEKLSRTLAQLEGRARISGKPTGLLLDETGYTAMVWADGNWSALPRSRHPLSRGVEIRSLISPPERGEPQTPQLVFDPLGHSTIDPVILAAQNREWPVAFPAAAADTAP